MSAVVSIEGNGRWLQRSIGPTSSVTSRIGRGLRERTRALQARAESSIALMGPQVDVVSALHELAQNHNAENPSGEDADPIDAMALQLAIRLVRTLPTGLPMPEVDVVPDGSVVLDWTAARTRRFSVSIGHSGRLAYAWLEGSDSGYGVVRFDEETVPRQILEGIQRVIEHESTTIRAC